MINEYSIRDLEVLTGIRSHTIRIWEQRYSLLSPQRTDTNIRYYLDEDLRFLLQVALLNDNGYKISKITDLSKEELDFIYEDLIVSKPEPTLQVNALINTMIDMDEAAFCKIYDDNVRTLGVKRTIISIIYPFLHRIGMMWVTSKIKPIQEHFVAAIIRQKVLSAINSLAIVEEPVGTCLLFLPEKEYHELGLLLAQLILKEAGYKVYYAGANVPISNLAVANKKLNVDFALSLFSVYPAKKSLQKYVENLSEIFNGTQVYLSGAQSSFIKKVPQNIKVWKSASDLIKLVDASGDSPQQNRFNNPTGASE